MEAGRTLGEEIDSWLARKQAVSGLRDATVRFNERSSRIWVPFRGIELTALRRAPVEDFVARRAARAPRSAKNELEFLKRVLKDARGRGHRIDEGLLAIPPIRHSARRGRALSVDQLYELASWVPEHSKRLVLLAGMVGARQRVWFEMTDDLLDLRAGTLTIPDWLAKNGREHCIYFTELEVGLFREQLMVRAPGTALVFPTPMGRQWTESGFRERVWSKAVKAAKTNEQRKPGQRSVFDDFNFHLLRHTACSLMAIAGMDPRSPPNARVTRTEARSSSSATGICTSPRSASKPAGWKPGSTQSWTALGQARTNVPILPLIKRLTTMGAAGIEPATSRV